MYQNYSPQNYYNPYQNSMVRVPQTAEVQQQFPQYNPVPAPSLNGKIVDSKEVVKATEVTMGGYGIFPKADLSEIYAKVWNNNGTTSIVTYKPAIDEPPQESAIPEELIERIKKIEQRLDELSSKPNKGVGINAF